MTYEVVHFVRKIAEASIVVLVAASFGALLSAINEIYSRYPVATGRPIKGYLQVIKVLAYIAAGVMTITVLLNLEPFWFISGLGAMTAVILLIFRDTLLSFVAGIQLVNNDLVRVGDWIEMPQFNADGDVVDISLNVVKVLNWDQTITVIPTHKFLDNSFKNWRSMQEIGGRRIKRAINVDMSTIRFLTKQEVDKFSRFLNLKDYISQKQVEIDEYNKQHCPSDLADVPANIRHLTNIGTLRAYISAYLRKHPKIHQDMTFLIRQLAPTPQGLPLEIYVYTNDTRWAVYEGIQSDIFDHVLSIVPEFGLRVFQEPSGRDFASLTELARQGRNEATDPARVKSDSTQADQTQANQT
jgi:miniconductance mechanosensitive channel